MPHAPVIIQTTCVLSLDGCVRSGQESVPCDCTENISMNFMYICVWIFIFFLFIHDIYYMSIIIVRVRAGQEESTGVILSYEYYTV